jgi:hypothetical protein
MVIDGHFVTVSSNAAAAHGQQTSHTPLLCAVNVDAAVAHYREFCLQAHVGGVDCT